MIPVNIGKYSSYVVISIYEPLSFQRERVQVLFPLK